MGDRPPWWVEERPRASKPRVVDIQVTERQLLIDGAVVSRGELREHLRRIGRAGDDDFVRLRASGTTPARSIAPLLSAVQGAGYLTTQLEAGNTMFRFRNSLRLRAERLVVLGMSKHGPSCSLVRLADPGPIEQRIGKSAFDECIERACEPRGTAVIASVDDSLPLSEIVESLNVLPACTASGVPELRLDFFSDTEKFVPPRQVVEKDSTKTAVSGRLPPAVIQYVVRNKFPDFRRCFEAGLARNPELEGRITARFVIERDGRVSHVSDFGSTLGDRQVVQCTLSAFRTLRFPFPENGIVTVVYPIHLSPG